eukprot:60287_1
MDLSKQTQIRIGSTLVAVGIGMIVITAAWDYWKKHQSKQRKQKLNLEFQRIQEKLRTINESIYNSNIKLFSNLIDNSSSNSLRRVNLLLLLYIYKNTKIYTHISE